MNLKAKIYMISARKHFNYITLILQIKKMAICIFLPTENKIIFILKIIQVTSHSSTEFLKMFITFFYRPSKFGELYHTSWVCKECYIFRKNFLSQLTSETCLILYNIPVKLTNVGGVFPGIHADLLSKDLVITFSKNVRPWDTFKECSWLPYALITL